MKRCIQSFLATGMLISVAILTQDGCTRSSEERVSFERAEKQWRDQRDQAMRGPASWLTIAGLFWLEEGDNAFGTDAQNRIRLPKGSAPPFAGTFLLENGTVRVVSSGAAKLKIDGDPVTEDTLRSDAEGEPDTVELGDLRMWVIERGGRLAVRLRDLRAAAYRDYRGLTYYPPRAEYRVRGAYVPFPEPKRVMLATAIGTQTEMLSPGYVTFRFGECDCRLDVFADDPDSTELFIIFRDRTSGTETYGACRFMTAHVLDDGSVDLNFNRAYNPPCAFTPYATCPLPPRENELPVRVEAGEKRYGPGH